MLLSFINLKPNNMKHFFLLLTACTLLGCWQQETPIETIRPVKITEAKPLRLYNKEFIGSLTASQIGILAFSVNGYISHIPLSTGSSVKTGDIIAEIDPEDYILKVEAEKASYLTNKAAKERSDRLLSRGAVSQQENEIATSKLEASKARYIYAQNELEYTKLRAPFSGSIEAYYVEEYQSITIGQSICKLINPNLLEVQFTLPQSDIALSRSNPQFEIEIENHPTKRFSAKIKEVVDASVDGAGIPVTLTITDKDFSPKKLGIKAGFACRVALKVNENLTKEDFYTVPLTAIFTSTTTPTSEFVWLYNPKTQRVTKQKITTSGLFSTSSAIVTHGLDSTSIVVTAGVHQLTNNQKVKTIQN